MVASNIYEAGSNLELKSPVSVMQEVFVGVARKEALGF